MKEFIKRCLRVAIKKGVYTITNSQMMTHSPCGTPSLMVVFYIGGKFHSKKFYGKLSVEGDDLSEIIDARYKVTQIAREKMMRKKFKWLY